MGFFSKTCGVLTERPGFTKVGFYQPVLLWYLVLNWIGNAKLINRHLHQGILREPPSGGVLPKQPATAKKPRLPGAPKTKQRF